MFGAGQVTPAGQAAPNEGAGHAFPTAAGFGRALDLVFATEEVGASLEAFEGTTGVD